MVFHMFLVASAALRPNDGNSVLRESRTGLGNKINHNALLELTCATDGIRLLDWRLYDMTQSGSSY
jgi:hypothetical protein